MLAQRSLQERRAAMKSAIIKRMWVELAQSMELNKIKEKFVENKLPSAAAPSPVCEQAASAGEYDIRWCWVVRYADLANNNQNQY
jgi:hypothetical protein